MEIKHGARVSLHHASPEMIVREALDDGRLVCEWMEDGKINSAAFPLSALRSDRQHATARKSGSGGYRPSHRMTVIEHLDGPKVRCCWFEDGRYRVADFGWEDIEVEAWMNSPRFKHVKRPEA